MLPPIVMALALSLALTAAGFWVGRTIVQIMSDHLIREMTQAVHRDVAHIVEDIDKALSRVANDFARHDVPLGDPLAVARELYGLLTAERDLDWLYFGNEAGGLVSVGRLADGATVFLMTDGFRAGILREFEALPNGGVGRLRKTAAAFDTRQKIWYTRPKETSKPYWTELYLGAVDPVAGVSLSAPVFDKDGSFAGAYGTDLILTQLASLMRTLQLGDHGRTFLVDAAGQLIASSGGVLPVSIDADGRHSLLSATEADDPVVRSTARHLSLHPEIVKQTSAGPHSVSFEVPELGVIYAAVDQFQAPGGIDWTVVSALPAEDFLGPVWSAAYFSLATGASIVVAALLLGLWAVGAALKPLAALTNVAQGIARGEWRAVPDTRRNDEIGVLATAFSVMTARLKETLDGLRDSQAKLEEAQRIAHLGYWDRELDTDLLTWSDEIYRIYGLVPQERKITIAAWQELIHPEDRRSVIGALAQALRGGPPYDVMYRVVRPDGAVRTVHSQGHVTKDESGQPRMFGTVQDITERKRAAENLRESELRYRESQIELAHANRVTTMGQLSATIAHEVSQPIAATVINGGAALRWLDSQPPNLEEVRQALGRVLESSNRAVDVMGRIHALMKRAPPRKDGLEINEAILEVIDLTRGEVVQNCVSVRTQLAEGLPLLQGDRVQLQQVILNLIVNAVEAMKGVSEDSRELLISTGQAEPDGVLVAVQDRGPVLAQANLERVFEAFYTTKPGGLGMGLSICHSIIEAHGGRLWVSANVSQGATFHFTLPTHPDNASSLSASREPETA